MTVADIHNIFEKGLWPVELIERGEATLPLSYEDYDDIDGKSIAKTLPSLDISVANGDIGNVGVISDSPTEERKFEIQAAINNINSNPPDLTQYRTWTDCTGEWKTLALFAAYKDNHISILKPNGQALSIPVQRMSHEDVEAVKLAVGSSES